MMEKQPLFGRLFIEQSFFRLQFHYHFLFFLLPVNKKLLRSKNFFRPAENPCRSRLLFSTACARRFVGEFYSVGNCGC